MGACLARFKLVPVEEDGRKRKKRRIEGEREKEKRQEEEKGGSRQGGEARNGTVLTGLKREACETSIPRGCGWVWCTAQSSATLYAPVQKRPEPSRPVPSGL